MSMLIRAELATANIEMNGRICSIGTPGAAVSTTVDQRGVAVGQLADRHERHRAQRDEHVDEAGDRRCR